MVRDCGSMRCNDFELTELSELAVGDQQSAESLKTLQGLVGILLGIILGEGRLGALGITGGDILGLPDEVLKKLAVVLDQKRLLGLFKHIAHILHEDLALVRKLRRRRREVLGVQGTVQRNIALLVL